MSQPVPITGVFALKATVGVHTDAITRFIAALKEGNNFILAHSVDDLAQMTTTLPDAFGTTAASRFTDSWTLVKLQISSSSAATFGRTSEDRWKETVQAEHSWGIQGADPADARLSYSAAVDTALFDKAKA